MMKTTVMTDYFEGENQNILIHCSYESPNFVMEFEDTNRKISVNAERFYQVLKDFEKKKRGLKNMLVERDSKDSLKGGFMSVVMNENNTVTLKVEKEHYHVDRYDLFEAVMSELRLSGELIEVPKKGFYSYAKFEKYIPTDEDWYPNVRGNLVRVFILCNVRIGAKQNPGLVRIGVWGNDDTGMDLDFEGSEQECVKKFAEWKKEIYDKLPEPLNRKDLKELGFING